MSSRGRLGSRLALAAVASLALSCASIELTRDTQTSGQFESHGFAVTLFSYDFPAGALTIARDNIADVRLTNYQVEQASVWPYLGWFDWLLDIAGVRWAVVRGTWGFTGSEHSTVTAK